MIARYCLVLITCASVMAQDTGVKITKAAAGYQLLRNGQPYFIRGAAGSRYLDQLVAAGGNSIRSYGGGDVLDQAQAKGLTVLLGLSVGKPRQGFDYTNAERVARQNEQIRETAMKYKDHPALLMWALGNEVELDVNEAPQRIQLWKQINTLAEMVKKLDGNHPVIIVLAGFGRSKLGELKEYCPAVDAVGINAYASMMRVPEALAEQGWDKPYLVTEFGPRGHWEVPKTAWGLPIEDSSTEKADLYLTAYRHAIQGQPLCLGSYVFLWGQKQEKTHTWYGMFLPDGSPLGAVDAMTEAWTGKAPVHPAPRIGSAKIQARAGGKTTENVFPAGATLQCTVDTGVTQETRIEWDLRLDVSDAPQRGGDREPPTEPLAGAVLSSSGKAATIRVPDKPGNYRIFVYVRNATGAAATANLPIRVTN